MLFLDGLGLGVFEEGLNYEADEVVLAEGLDARAAEDDAADAPGGGVTDLQLGVEQEFLEAFEGLLVEAGEAPGGGD